MALTLEKLLENSTPKPFELPSYDEPLGPTVKMRDIIGIASMIFAEQNLWAVPARRGLHPVKVTPHVLGCHAPLVWLYSTLLDEDYYLCRKTLQGAYTQVYAIFVPFDRIRAPYTDNLLIYINGKIIRHPRLGPKSVPDSCADWVYNKLRNLLELVSVLPNRENYRLVPRRRELPTLCASKLLETGSEALKELLNEDYYFEEDSDKLGFHFTRQIHSQASLWRYGTGFPESWCLRRGPSHRGYNIEAGPRAGYGLGTSSHRPCYGPGCSRPGL